ncbi:chromosome partitioning ATPase [Candidatus Mancarchaeum acidiphilum]|uniref:Iron-sulfur cluster carrier protein n=1 Tax=Candidatus Mancarchaeum acidiphilum TaxID=1920749 RepID=A0A218NPE0_9ARCH|nr:P-loop NTPase [Candidatus Mancarchaeum acidiphilum]ASI14294.1 chromosome partitioning ATPase [Candidatus Mancarchaeum acidiphilum]
MADLIDNSEDKTIPMHPSFAGVFDKKQAIKKKLSSIRYKIGVYSAKGGVGKTTVSVNLAYALKDKGYKVGLLDADIDCPNIPLFLGITDKINATRLPLRTFEKDGIKISSTGMLVGDIEKPIIWRGPIIAKMIDDFLLNTDWGDLDFLIIDLPPGTSDAPLSIMQLLDLTGFVLVTTPQKISGENSVRSGLMAKRLGIPILGIVENMSRDYDARFTNEVSNKLNTDILANIGYDEKFNHFSDSGKVAIESDGKIKDEFYMLADKIIKLYITK